MKAKKPKKIKVGLIIALILLLFILFILVASFLQQLKQPVEDVNQENVSLNEYNPEINPSEFTSEITNKYLTFTPGKKMIYEAQVEEGLEKIEVYVTDEKKTVMGVETTVVWDRVWLNDELIENTKDWYAQDEEGNVWYFGEYSETLVNNQVVSTKGSWEAGVDNALPGIVMKASPKVGDSYKQEYYKDEAEDMADILALDEMVTVPYGEFNDCLKTFDYTPLEPDVKEHKYYCSEFGGFVLEIDVNTNERVELISLEYNAEPTSEVITEEPIVEESKQPISEEEAKAIAIEEVPGQVTDISVEKYLDWVCYVVEIDPNSGSQTDVYVDIYTGNILNVDT